MNYPIVIYPCEEGGFVAEIPALKGCLAQGETIEGTFQELRTVFQLWVETAQSHHQRETKRQHPYGSSAKKSASSRTDDSTSSIDPNRTSS